MSKINYSKEIADIVNKFLTDDEWNYSFDEEHGIFQFDLRLTGILKNIKYLIRIKPNEILFYGYSPITADEDNPVMMARMAEFICRANYGLRNGYFQFDFRDGEIFYKSYIDCDQLLPSAEVVRNAVYVIAAMFKRYAPGIVDIIFTNTTAVQAVEKCEMSFEERLRTLLCDSRDEEHDDAKEGSMGRPTEYPGITGDGNVPSEEESDTAEEFHLNPFSGKRNGGNLS